MRMIGSSKYGQKRPLLKAKWHALSSISKFSDFFIQNPSICNIESYEERFKEIKEYYDNLNLSCKTNRIQLDESKKRLYDFTLIDKENDEITELICLITEHIRNGLSKLCDKEYKYKICYENLMFLSFAYIHACVSKDNNFSTRVQDKYEPYYDLWLTDIFILYRHGEGRNPLDIWRGFTSSHHNYGIDKKRTETYTIASLHYWARENPKYKDIFQNGNKSELISTLERGDIGLSELFFNVYGKDNMITIDSKGNGYMWNDDKKLWIYHDVVYMQNKLQIILENHIRNELNEMLKTLNECGISESENINVNIIKSSIDYIIKRKNINNIYQVVLSHTRNDTFESHKNRTIQTIPVKKGMLLNLKTLEIFAYLVF